MPVLCARAADNVGAGKRPKIINIGPGAALVVTLMVAGCSAVPPLPRAAAAADADIAVPATRYSSVTAPYTRQRPVEPLPWLDQNQRVAPSAQP